METPNTRSRKKREKDLLSSSQSREAEVGAAEVVDERPEITWLHDQDLRRAVLQATEDDVILPPTPTQKPRPISARFSISESEPRQPPRKRQCRARAHRSLPTSLRRPSGGASSANVDPSLPITSTGASSLPSMSSVTLQSTMHSVSSTAGGGAVEEGKTRLDLLLERIQILASPPDPPRHAKATKSIKAVGSEEITTPSRTLRSREIKTGSTKPALSLESKSASRSNSGVLKELPDARGMSCATRGQAFSGITPTRTRSGRNAENMHPHASDRIGHQQPSLARYSAVTDKNDDRGVGPSSIRHPLSPIKSSAPRIGLASSQHSKNILATGLSSGNHQKAETAKTENTFARSTLASTTNVGRSFRTPFLNPQSRTQHHAGAIAVGARGASGGNVARSSGSCALPGRIPSPVRAPAPAPVPAPALLSTGHSRSRSHIPAQKASSSSTNSTPVSASIAKRPSTPARGSSSRSSTSAHSLATTHKSDNSYSCSYGFGDSVTFDVDLDPDMDLGFDGAKRARAELGPGSEGDNSFDSFDGMFEEGGEEIELLLRTVDGSR
ncbi:hypothetical protein I316_01481 [Kwoniella heveanensis BCC8398]|uniref:Uncharacterized protein n=1 Tax=Kwoniella heveanensis BCC8398 TaxID=1296120 RepID=A0A1B9H0W6_9TREE|nr:hypothetical protein I316_01481 [Kwoniella heveanensis BCC8398]